MGKKYIGYAGTYTRENSEGIYSFVLDTEAGKISKAEVAAKVGSPTYLTISADNQYLYAVAQEDKMGGVHAYQINNETGVLQMINGQLTEGAPPCHINVRNNAVVTGNYHKGTIGLNAVNEQGGIEPITTIKHDGSGPHERQEKPHVHYAGHTPDGKYVVVADLGTDELVTYQIKDNELNRVQTLRVKPGSGPRHIAFHPNGKTAYLMTELSSEVMVLDYDSEQGCFTEKQTISALPEDFTETNDASAIHISSDGKFVYTGNRGHNSIALFSVDDSSNELTFIEHTATGGKWPRDFVLDPSEQFIVASNQHSGNLVLFARDGETGKLTKLDSEVQVPEVVCVKFRSN
ncbi:6-phosphogluconolactonase [Virgibacillus halotolerans]|uniref:lactonase family protein n=1 Tax=Virgibacillus halotolerans TaxID=1071053 RepID=UPI001960DC07|nr:lactonase family protein [Virgibacillus halotolerans]MBM7600886.1 6-phosphogluconolactonase [Virgibacillus halotolerans]